MIPGGLGPWLLGVLVLVAVVARRRWQPVLVRRWGASPARWRWWLFGYPVTVVRMRWWWRQVCQLADLSISPGGTRGLLGGLVVRGTALRQVPPRLGWPKLTRDGLVVVVRLHPGQVPTPFLRATDAFTHAWRVHRVRAESVRRGEVVITVTAVDPLREAADGHEPATEAGRLLAPVIGRTDEGPWVVDLRMVPHWLVVGATTSGKSSWLSALLAGLAHQPVDLVGVDLKGGLGLGPWQGRLSTLATTRAEAVELLRALVAEVGRRMDLCRTEGVQAAWELPKPPPPVVLVVDEVAELTLGDGSRAGRDEALEAQQLLLRLVQLGAALDVHVIVAGQRVGSDLGALVTSIRAQLPGRVCHRVSDAATAEMALGDLAPDALAAALAIAPDEPGVCVTVTGGRWLRARAAHVPAADARRIASETSLSRPFSRLVPVPEPEETS